MNKQLFILVSLVLHAFSGQGQQSLPTDSIREGDIVFQSSISPQCKAIEAATHSPWTHCGMVLKQNGELYVLEAVEPVMYTPLESWAARSHNHIVVKRVKDNNVVNSGVIDKMKKAGEKYRGKHYDAFFEWSDERIYCSELVWKIYKETTGLEIGKLKPLGSFDLSSDIVKQTMAQRYGNKIPLQEKMIAPSVMFDSELLTTVYKN
ncbi:YiiX family permuted papain-like enzyme [uncultured Chitinophaga sp.]|uniref:YiiX family permuted papain-like enzyme n=1 Tax=uncultured Chitinophaga sp. TaxID=339340 RepID=UPI0025E003EC|nr:YiiX family permuted papain-like enzyme [uncultured Chitinophaga sp.]